MTNKKTAAKSLLATIGIVAGVLLFVLLVAHYAPASVPGRHPNSLGVIPYQDNPNTYKAGNVTNINYAGEEANYGMVIRLQSLGTYSLFTEEIFLCGNPSDILQGKHNPVVITYETRSHHTVEGIGCHELRRVNEIRAENLK